MAVYVDMLWYYAGKGFWKDKKSCHLFADSIEELKDFAINKLGMKEDWFQHKEHSLPHFDLESRRLKAVSLGAIEFNSAREAVKLYEKLREIYYK